MQISDSQRKINSRVQKLVKVIFAISFTITTSLPPTLALSEDKDIETRLAEIIEKIHSKKMEEALRKVEDLTKDFPNFALGYLIMGDLLSAKYTTLNKPGSDNDSQKATLDLIEEAVARINRHYGKNLPSTIPENLIKIPSKYAHVIVVDASKATMYVFKNSNDEFHYVTNFYISIGKKGMGKFREGDKKTPIGIYRVTSRIDSSKLSDFYGAGAFPINYPNNWDQLQGYSGYGIWLHGTPTSTFSRPPKASDGCVVLSNIDFETLSQYIDASGTPIVIAKEIKWTSPNQNKKNREALLNELKTWKTDWESLDIDRYLNNYSEKFTDGKRDFRLWSNRKKIINSRKQWIKVLIEDISISIYPGEKNIAAITFKQSYKSNNLNDQMSKIQYWSKENDNWKIIYEGKH